MGIFGKTENRPAEAPKPATVSTPPAVNPAPAPAPAPASSPRASHAPQPAVASGPACVIGAKTRIKGDVTGDENIQVEGYVEGSIRISRDLRIGAGGTVKASVQAQSVVVAGELLGDCTATQRVQIEATGRMTGNIRAPRVVIVEGATFRGNSDMSSPREGQA